MNFAHFLTTDATIGTWFLRGIGVTAAGAVAVVGGALGILTATSAAEAMVVGISGDDIFDDDVTL